jgi:hypothetical protein
VICSARRSVPSSDSVSHRSGHPLALLPIVRAGNPDGARSGLRSPARGLPGWSEVCRSWVSRCHTGCLPCVP